MESRYLRLTLPAVGLAVCLAWPSGAAAGELSQAAMLANSCMGCHGTDGQSPGGIPSIAGKSAKFLETTLKEFRSGERPSTVMGRHAKGYSDEEIALIARYFAAK